MIIKIRINNITYYIRDFCAKFRFNNCGILFSEPNGAEKMGELVKIEVNGRDVSLYIEEGGEIKVIQPNQVIGRAIIVEYINAANVKQKHLYKPLTIFNDIIK